VSRGPIQHATKLAQAADGTTIPGPPYSGPAVKPILDGIDSPADMKRLDMRQLKQVCLPHVYPSFFELQYLLALLTCDNRYMYL